MKRFIVIVMAGLFSSISLYAQHTRPGHDWTVNPSAYDFNMTIVVQVQQDGVVDPSLEIGAFCEEECRGTALAKYESVLNKYVWYVVIQGNSGDPINFYVRQADVELDVETTFSLVFTPNNIIGNTTNPIIVNFTTTSTSHDYLLVTDPSQLVDGRNYLFSATKILDVTNATEITIESWDIDVNADGTSMLVNLSTEEILEGYLFAQCVFISGSYDILDVANAQTMYVVPSGCTLTVNELNTVDVSNLIVEDGAQLVNASPNVHATFQKNLIAYTAVDEAEGWYTVAAPLIMAEVASNSNMTSFDYDLYEFDETNLTHEEWRNYKIQENFKDFTPGKGYLYANGHDLTLNFFGTLNVSNISIAMTYTDDRTDELKGFNLIGNPYPHVIYKGQGAAIDDSRLAAGYYFLSNDGIWQTKTYTDPIQPGMGILVMTSEAGNLNIFKTTAQATSESSSRRDSGTGMGRIALSVGNGDSKDVAYLYGGTDKRNLKKISHMNINVPELSFYCDQQRYAIAYCDGGDIPVRFDNRMASTFVMTWDISDWQGEHPYLIDNFTGAMVDMLSMQDYTFEACGNEHPFRFRMVLDNGFEGGGIINPCLQGEGILHVYDIMGRVVLCSDDASLASIEGLTPGVYVVRWIDGNNVSIQKIVVR